MNDNSKAIEENALITLLFRHHLWANLGLFDACLELDPSQLKLAVPGTYGSIWTTLIHLVRAEERYLFFLNRQEYGSVLDDDSETPLTELRKRIKLSGEGLLKVSGRMQPDKLVQVGDGDEAEIVPTKVLLLQSIHHAHEHRTQIATIMGQLGIDPPSLSGWRYFDTEIASNE